MQEETLGQLLKRARQKSDMSVRQVAKCTGIADYYLETLESDTRENPSPSVLWKLAQTYRISYETLIRLAGILIKKDNTQQQNNG